MENILKYLGTKTEIDEDILEEASNLAKNNDLVLNELYKTLQPIVPNKNLVPTSPVSIPQLPVNSQLY